MSDRLKSQVYRGWRGGLFAGPGLSPFEAASLRTENATKENLLQADNCVLDEFGSVTGRPGIVAGAASPDYGLEPTDFINAAGYQYVNCGLNIFQNAAVPISIYNHGANTGRGRFIYFAGRFSFANGRGTMQSWLPGAVASGNALGAPVSRVLHIHNNRVFCANGDVLYETAPGTGPSDVVDNFATGQTWTIRGVETDVIVGVASLGRDLYIFKNKSIHIQTGFTVNERQTREFSRAYGCKSVESIQTVNLKGIGEAIVFLSQNSVLCAIYGGDVHEIGETVERITTSIKQGYAANDAIPSAPTLVRPWVVSCVSQYGFYILGYVPEDGTVGFPSGHTCALILHLNNQYQSQFGVRWPFTIWKDATATEASTFPITFGCIGRDDSLIVPNIGTFQKTPAGKFLYFVFNNFSKNDVDNTLPVADRTFPVRPTIKTIDDNLGSDDLYKNLFEMVIYASTIDALFSFTYTETTDLGDTPINGDSITSLGAVAQKYTPIVADLKNDVRRVSITLVLIYANQKVHALEIRYTKGASI